MKKKLLALLICLSCINAHAQILPPYSQDFETATFPPTGWQTFPVGSFINWERDTTSSGYGTGTACTSFDNYNTAAGSYYGIRLPSMNFSNVSQPYIRFDIAYAQRPAASSDIFGLWWSNNGSSNWLNIVNYSGVTLTTAPATSGLFVPTAAQWQTKTRSLSSLAGLSFVRLAIEDDCSHGNKIYFDNVIVFDSSTVGLNELLFSNQMLIFPDPFGSFITISSGSKQTIFRAYLYNIMGSIVASAEQTGLNLRIENLSGLPEGIYFLRLDMQDGKTFFKKIIKQ